MKLVYGVSDKPPLKKNLLYAFQQPVAFTPSRELIMKLFTSDGG